MCLFRFDHIIPIIVIYLIFYFMLSPTAWSKDKLVCNWIGGTPRQLKIIIMIFSIIVCLQVN